jgi:hypothetical protein
VIQVPALHRALQRVQLGLQDSLVLELCLQLRVLDAQIVVLSLLLTEFRVQLHQLVIHTES